MKQEKEAFAPYSEYPVGAALVANGEVYTGANIEVSGRSTSVHGEMMAAYNAVFDGSLSFEVIAISPDGETGVAPCGLCQHTLAQWAEELRIIEDSGEEESNEYQLSELIGPAYSPSTRHSKEVNKNNCRNSYVYSHITQRTARRRRGGCVIWEYMFNYRQMTKCSECTDRPVIIPMISFKGNFNSIECEECAKELLP